MKTPSPSPLESIHFDQQPSGEQITCTAFALIHALRIAHAQILKNDPLEMLRQEILSLGTPLNIDRKEEIAGQYGYEMVYLSEPEKELKTSESLIDFVVTCLEQYPSLIMAISTFLSKRDKSTSEVHQDQLAFELRGKPIVHEIVLTKNARKIFLIDSYNPPSPEVFDLEKDDDRNRLTLWISSTFLQKRSEDPESFSEDPESFSKDVEYIKAQKLPPNRHEDFFWTGIYEAKMFGIKRKNASTSSTA